MMRMGRPTPPLTHDPMSSEPAAFKIRNASFPLFVLHARTAQMETFKQQLRAHVAQAPEFFAGAPATLALDGDALPDFADLAAFMRKIGLPLVGLVGGSPAQRDAARAAGLGLLPEKPDRARATRAQVSDAMPAETEAGPAEAQSTAPGPASVTAADADVASADTSTGDHTPSKAGRAVAEPRGALVIDKPVRAGQRIHAEGRDLVVLAIVNAGAELIADGDIHVYAPLRGRALAGARGNTAARIYAQAMEAELVAIAGYYLVFEQGVPQEARGKAAQVYLDGERVSLSPLRPLR